LEFTLIKNFFQQHSEIIHFIGLPVTESNEEEEILTQYRKGG
jgi:hypothetical protein